MAVLLRLCHCNSTGCKMELPGFAVWMFVCLCASVIGYPNGRVREACTSMVPCHGSSPQLSPEHTITVNGTEFKPGDNIEVHLSGPDFEGFFIQARDAEHLDSPAVGSFVLADRRRAQLLTCGRTKNSAVSHTSKVKKKDITVYWIAPKDAPKHVQFLATVVKKYRIFWVKIPGPIVSQPDVPSPTPPLYATSEAMSTSHPVSYISKPGGDDAYLCVNEDHRVRVSTACLKERSQPLLDSENALEDVSWRLADGVLQCSFRRSIRLPAYKGRFNLDTSYYIFLADGEASEGGLLYKHRRQPLVTAGLYNVTGPPQDIGGSRAPRLIKAHGASYAYVDHSHADKHFFCVAFCIPRRLEPAEVIEDDRVQILQSLTSAEAEGRLFKQIVLTIYVCGNVVFLVAFLIAINQV
ncbi:hypothetical protein DUI87_14696 [Hirundo rustica rustica]|uniref:Reelin domain-containing protein n=1 Tax=Hirundo rustica rustica TaxID=333673 RepID=A0A3M0K5J3_HIRRU|nr:hypothetical protein DUI87_14696 [Hirundo rustica rustica]